MKKVGCWLQVVFVTLLVSQAIAKDAHQRCTKWDFLPTDVVERAHKQVLSDPAVLVSSCFGEWQVQCIRDVITDKVRCELIAPSGQPHREGQELLLSIKEDKADKYTLSIFGPAKDSKFRASEVVFQLRVDANSEVVKTSSDLHSVDTKNFKLPFKKGDPYFPLLSPTTNIVYQMSQGKFLYIRKQEVFKLSNQDKSPMVFNTDYKVPLLGFSDALRLYNQKMQEYHLMPVR